MIDVITNNIQTAPDVIIYCIFMILCVFSILIRRCFRNFIKKMLTYGLLGSEYAEN